MITYNEFEEATYKQLAEWRETYGWDFSLRKQGRKGARTNRFIGKETGGYFGTTFWDSSTQYGGQPVGFITLLFRLDGDRINYEFEIRQSASAEGDQNELAADFLRRLQANNYGLGEVKSHNKEGASIMYLTIRSKRFSYGLLTDLFEDLKFHLKDFINNFDTEIFIFKEEHPEFALRRLEPKDTKMFEESYRRRLEKYGSTEEVNEADQAISVKQWTELLGNTVVFKQSDLEMVNAFYHSPNHQSTVWAVDAVVRNVSVEKKRTGHINNVNYQLTQRIEPQLDAPFPYRKQDDGSVAYYSMLFIEELVSGYWEWRMLPNLVKAFKAHGIGDKPDFSVLTKTVEMPAYPLNQILYGPPGTGKTYATIEMAVRIANPAFTQFSDREALHSEFRRLKEVRRIAFTTFHQSLSYEDFVEGIRPVLTNVDDETTDTKTIDYEIKDGVFKELVSFAATVNNAGKGTGSVIDLDPELLQKAQVYKMSLGDANNPADEEIYRYCIDKGFIALGYGEDIDFSQDQTRQQIKERIKASDQISTDRQLYTTSAITYFKLEMQRGDIVLVSNGNRSIRAIGIVGGDYKFRSNAEIRFSQFRPVKWLQTDLNLPIKKVYGKAFSQMTVYRMEKNAIVKGLMELTEETRTPTLRNHVLIIDEINRGNVSAILGELITLLEPDKRLGGDEALTVTLPYSRDEFGVPPNLYLIGTMNTADRSVEALDAALRRRFTFKEVAPDPAVISRVHPKGGIVSVGELEVDLAKLLTLLNRRIKALKDADHQLGHSYFLRVNDWQGLASAFCDRIIPLLREYFFANYGQLQMVVGKGFCRQESEKEFSFADSDQDEEYGSDYQSYLFHRPASAAELADYLGQLGLL